MKTQYSLIIKVNQHPTEGQANPLLIVDGDHTDTFKKGRKEVSLFADNLSICRNNPKHFYIK